MQRLSLEKSDECVAVAATGDRAGADAGAGADNDNDIPSVTGVTASVGLGVVELRELCDDGASSINASGDFNAPVPVAAAVPNNSKKPRRRGPGPIRGFTLQMVSGYPQDIELQQRSFLPASKNDVEKAAILKGAFCREVSLFRKTHC